MQYKDELKIPKERIAVLIGKNGEEKARIEKKTNTELGVDSKEGDIIITSEDGLNIYHAKLVIKAIARGFNPRVAELLTNENYIIEIIEITDYCGKSKSKMIRLRGRVIGEKGKARRVIEQLTDTDISIYGKTISIIGLPENVNLARRAMESLLSGSPHSSIYKGLEKRKKELKRLNFL